MVVDQYRSLQELVESSLRTDIVEGIFPPGAPLLERELTERYGVSRGPIREVLRALEVQGLVVRTRSKGARVAELSLAEMNELYDLRVVLEGLAARYALEAATNQAIDRVRIVYERLRATPLEQREWLQRNNEFHCAIYNVAHRPILLDLIQHLMWRVEPYARLYLEDREHLIQSAAEHEEIWQAFLERDADRCQDLTQRHLAAAGAVMEINLDSLSSASGLQQLSPP